MNFNVLYFSPSFYIYKQHISEEGGKIFTTIAEEIQIINGNIVKIKKLNDSVLVLENIIAHLNYNGQKLEKDSIVENAKLPSIAKTFYEIIYNGKIPYQERLCNYYLKKYFLRLDSEMCKEKSTNIQFKINGLKARILRTFPSLIRDFHFYILCLNSNYFQLVKYSLYDDFKNGIDLSVTYNNKEYNISLFVKTNRSIRFKEKKYSRHDYSKVNEICLPIDPFNKDFYVGNFALYRKQHVEYLYHKIRQLDRLTSTKQICINE